MPSLEINDEQIPPVAAFATLLSDLLARAEQVKPSASIEPALSRADFGDLSAQLSDVFAAFPHLDDEDKSRKFAVIEIAVRDLFGRLVVSTRPTQAQ